MKPLLSPAVATLACLVLAAIGTAAHAQTTPWGAIATANKDGTIPAYAGGLTQGPKIDRANYGLPDPYAADKPLFVITADNMAEHGDKLSDGLKEMLRKYKTFKVVVYPTRRSVAYPQSVLDNTQRNVERCALKNDGEELDVSKGCANGFPFPSPKNGHEAIWNFRARYYGAGRQSKIIVPYIKSNGEIVITGDVVREDNNGLYLAPEGSKPTREWSTRSEYLGPTRVAGGLTIIADMLDGKRRSYSYSPATRRVRLAPDLAGDTPIPTAGGAYVYDEINLFSGSMARWDVQLVGRKEMYIPYNTYGWGVSPGCQTPQELLTPLHYKPECVRFELHRVWHVHMTLKPGQRHIYSKRDIFVDEDAWYGGLTQMYDQQGKLYRIGMAGIGPDWEKRVPLASELAINLDLNSGVWVPAVFNKSIVVSKPMPESYLGPDQADTLLLKPR